MIKRNEFELLRPEIESIFLEQKIFLLILAIAGFLLLCINFMFLKTFESCFPERCASLRRSFSQHDNTSNVRTKKQACK